MKNDRSHSIDMLFVLLLFAVFIIMALAVSASSAAAYKKSCVQCDQRFNRQTCISYITAKIRSNNEAGKISIVQKDGVNALCITDSFESSEYHTYIYQYKGTVRELFCNAAVDIDLNAGSVLAEASDLKFSLDSGLFKISLTDLDGQSAVFYVNSII